MNAEHEAGERTPLLAFLAVIALWAALLVPNYSLREFGKEEGRRALASQEMLETGDLVLPTIWGRPYLSKPPAMFWAIGLASQPSGEVTTASARLPSLLATLATALLVCWLGTRHGSRLIGILGASVFLLTPMVGEKGVSAETDAILAFGSFAALALAWVSQRGSRLALLGSVLALALAVLTKGPAALVFFFGGPLALLVTDRRRALPFLVRCTLLALGALALSAIWFVLLLGQMDGEVLQETWSHEVSRGGDGRTLAIYLSDMRKFVTRSFLGLIPASLLWAFSASRSSQRSPVARTEAVRLAIGCVIAGYLFFLLFPGTRARYVYPIAPWFALWSGFVLQAALAKETHPGPARALRALVLVTGIVGVVAGLAAVVNALGADFDGFEISLAGYGFAVLLLIAGVAAIRSQASGARSRALVLALVVLALVRGFTLTNIIPATAKDHDFEAKAAQLDAALPAATKVYTVNWDEFNLMAYLEHPVEFTFTPWDTVAPGDLLLAERVWLSEAPPEFDLSQWEALRSFPARKGRVVVLLKRNAESN